MQKRASIRRQPQRKPNLQSHCKSGQPPQPPRSLRKTSAPPRRVAKAQSAKLRVGVTLARFAAGYLHGRTRPIRKRGATGIAPTAWGPAEGPLLKGNLCAGQKKPPRHPGPSACRHRRRLFDAPTPQPRRPRAPSPPAKRENPTGHQSVSPSPLAEDSEFQPELSQHS